MVGPSRPALFLSVLFPGCGGVLVTKRLEQLPRKIYLIPPNLTLMTMKWMAYAASAALMHIKNRGYPPPGSTRHRTMLLLPLCTDFFSTIFCRESEKGTSRVETSLEFLSRVTLKGAARYCLRQTPIDFQRQKDFTSSESVCYVWLLNVCSDGTCHSRCQKA